MRIGVIGDTHGDIHSIKQAVGAIGPVDLWMHTGDFFRDALVLGTFVDVPVTSVAGNCDGRVDAKADEFVEMAGYQIWLTHGHRHGVKQNLKDLRDWAQRYEADIVVFGHTHQPESIVEKGLLLFNPGSCSMPKRGKSRTCGMIDLMPERQGIFPHIISIP
ncbi:MAG TPA: YfcE family phosphodiesterase [Negativicutes bacterium]|nr:YfcE family phosphodiesterase [Negativicutes bacterium]